MSRLKFGDIVGMDYEPEMRLMVVALDLAQTAAKSVSRVTEVWRAVVLTDRDSGWPIGLLVTMTPDVSGFVLIEQVEGSGLA